MLNGHGYQYEPARSNWVMEVQADTFEKAGLGDLDEAQSARFLEKVFADELRGHKLLINRSTWRNFPRVSNEHWVKDNIVLIGDAKATAHWSIGSGTKLAMQDAIALYDAFRATDGRNVPAALARFETTRREEVERTRTAAEASIVWFEHVERFWSLNSERFGSGLVMRPKAIPHQNLPLLAPARVAADGSVG